MLNLRFLLIGLHLISLVTFISFLLCGLMFYEFYFEWILLFENGRYFNPETGVVYHDSSIIFGILSLVLLLLSIVMQLFARKIKRRTDWVRMA